MHIFVMLGEAMKVHCAPIRDDMVDDMVRTAGSDVALGLRKCFDCVEVMKLVSRAAGQADAGYCQPPSACAAPTPMDLGGAR
jgi:hypothetical protein